MLGPSVVAARRQVCGGGDKRGGGGSHEVQTLGWLNWLRILGKKKKTIVRRGS